MRTYVVGANLERLFLPHEEPGLLGLLVLQKFRLPYAALFPFLGVFVESVHLALPARAMTLAVGLTSRSLAN